MRTANPVKIAAACAAGVVLAAGCGAGGGGSGDDEGLSIVTGVYPLQWLAEEVAGEHGSVTNLTKPGAEPHDLELTGRQTGEVVDADVAFYVEGLQPAVDEAVAQSETGNALNVADLVELRSASEDKGDPGHSHGEDGHGEGEHGEEGDGHSHGHAHGESEPALSEAGNTHAQGEDEPVLPEVGDDDNHGEDEPSISEVGDTHDHGEDEPALSEVGDDHDHGESDPHMWLDTERMAETAAGLAERLGETDPDHAEDYTANAERVSEELTGIGDDYSSGLAECDSREMVVDHAAFGYLAAQHDLHQISVAGIDPESEPSPARIAEVAETVREYDVDTIFTETLTSPETAETIAGETGAETAVLDPLEGITDKSPGDDYPSVMRANLESLTTGLGCS